MPLGCRLGAAHPQAAAAADSRRPQTKHLQSQRAFAELPASRQARTPQTLCHRISLDAVDHQCKAPCRISAALRGSGLRLPLAPPTPSFLAASSSLCQVLTRSYTSPACLDARLQSMDAHTPGVQTNARRRPRRRRRRRRHCCTRAAGPLLLPRWPSMLQMETAPPISRSCPQLRLSALRHTLYACGRSGLRAATVAAACCGSTTRTVQRLCPHCSAGIEGAGT